MAGSRTGRCPRARRLVLESAANATYEAAWIEYLVSERGVDQDTALRTLSAFRIWRGPLGQPDITD
jgi:hypothetical protein